MMQQLLRNQNSFSSSSLPSSRTIKNNNRNNSDVAPAVVDLSKKSTFWNTQIRKDLLKLRQHFSQKQNSKLQEKKLVQVDLQVQNHQLQREELTSAIIENLKNRLSFGRRDDDSHHHQLRHHQTIVEVDVGAKTTSEKLVSIDNIINEFIVRQQKKLETKVYPSSVSLSPTIFVPLVAARSSSSVHQKNRHHHHHHHPCEPIEVDLITTTNYLSPLLDRLKAKIAGKRRQRNEDDEDEVVDGDDDNPAKLFVGLLEPSCRQRKISKQNKKVLGENLRFDLGKTSSSSTTTSTKLCLVDLSEHHQEQQQNSLKMMYDFRTRKQKMKLAEQFTQRMIEEEANEFLFFDSSSLTAAANHGCGQFLSREQQCNDDIIENNSSQQQQQQQRKTQPHQLDNKNNINASNNDCDDVVDDSGEKVVDDDDDDDENLDSLYVLTTVVNSETKKYNNNIKNKDVDIINRTADIPSSTLPLKHLESLLDAKCNRVQREARVVNHFERNGNDDSEVRDVLLLVACLEMSQKSKEM